MPVHAGRRPLLAIRRHVECAAGDGRQSRGVAARLVVNLLTRAAVCFVHDKHVTSYSLMRFVLSCPMGLDDDDDVCCRMVLMCTD